MEAQILPEFTRDMFNRVVDRRSRFARVLRFVVAAGLPLAGCAPQQQSPAPVQPTPVVQRPTYVPPAKPVVPAKPTSPTVAHHEDVTILGTSREGRAIEMVVFGRSGEVTIILGAFHGNEPTSADVARELIRHLRSNPHAYQGRRVAIVPTVNPDGLALGTRANADGVDLNRNFPASNFPADPPRGFEGGPYPVSERETLAVLTAVRELQPAKIVSIHSIRRGEHGNNYDGPARALAVEMGRHNGYPLLPSMGYPTPGSFGVWAGVDRRIPTVTLELPREADSETCWRENREALLAAIRFPAGGEPVHVSDPTQAYRTGSGK